MWSEISNIGDAALTLPVALTCAIWLALSDWRLAVRWVALLAAGMSVVGATKILYAGCGIEIPQFDFRVISGHTMLSTSVWTVALSTLWQGFRAGKAPGVAAGLAVGAVTAIARVLDHSHTVPEVVAGWLLGAAVALAFLRAYGDAQPRAFSPRIAAVSLLLVSSIAYGHRAPFQQMIDTHSPQFCAFVRGAGNGA
ncbi:phosphatase PAP2 family protein [Burkholderia vietnamiensis]|uniref:phosphatase PAP2 family protein n=1 Tax=Burkholderia vietnamiensis TaxID=60552 RepID=UPI0007555A22|nr:phosphatase PAP2 family protein [Burkholderia vietnamiensis]KVF25832.1 phosphoesterase [Burkholderia vietnamiensis]KVF45953.1 phosphoesterase [Burkholderia vietnamiensis]KVF83564.1 phosphoesterase [Burkholderia vietnamiensis]KVF83997.1 phosphoesterase [Burkholderia vietnamiensis]KVF92397.1 phosphoesterase [Burkholderia vietnamiensis]